MKAAVFRGRGQPLVIEDRPVPTPGPGQLLLRVVHCGICGTDLRSTAADSLTAVKDGAILGHELCGSVAAIGDGVSGWREGDRAVSLPYIGCGACTACRRGEPVWCPDMRAITYGDLPGAFADYVVVGAAGSVQLPLGLSWRRAALVEPIAVGLHAARRAGLAPGDDMLVLGAGPIGLAVALCGRALGAGRIIVAARGRERAGLARELGATDLVSIERVADAFASGSIPKVFECVGAPGILARAIELAAPRATVVMLGAHGADESFLLMGALGKELSLVFSRAYDVSDFARAVEMLASGEINPDPMISLEVGFDAFPASLEGLRQRRDWCKVLLTPSL